MADNGANSNAERLDIIVGLLRQIVARERPQPRRLLRIKEAAAYLHVSDGTLRGLIQRGELPVVKIHKDSQHAPLMLDVHELDALIERSKS